MLDRKLLDLPLMNPAVLDNNFVESIVESKTFFFFSLVFICFGCWIGLCMQGDVAILS